MTRWVIIAVAVVGLSAVILVQLDGAAELVTWELFLLISALALLKGRWPTSPDPAGSLLSPAPAGSPRRPRSLSRIEMEVSGSVDPSLGGSRRLRKRLVDLARHRTDLGPLDVADLATAVGSESWRILTGSEDVLTIEEVETVVTRVERL